MRDKPVTQKLDELFNEFHERNDKAKGLLAPTRFVLDKETFVQVLRDSHHWRYTHDRDGVRFCDVRVVFTYALDEANAEYMPEKVPLPTDLVVPQPKLIALEYRDRADLRHNIIHPDSDEEFKS